MNTNALRSFGLGICLAAAAFASPVLAAGGNPLFYGKPDFDFAGTVYDNVTKQPIEGAYVVAIYREQVVSMAAMSSWCVKTLGMYTGKDGKFRFPVENRKGNSPLYAGAIKPDYFNGSRVFPPEDVWKKQGKEAYSGRDIYLIPQDPLKPDLSFGNGEEFCDRARTREDAAAGAQFLKIKLKEYEKYRADNRGREAVEGMINLLENLPRSTDRGSTAVSK